MYVVEAVELLPGIVRGIYGKYLVIPGQIKAHTQIQSDTQRGGNVNTSISLSSREANLSGKFH